MLVGRFFVYTSVYNYTQIGLLMHQVIHRVLPLHGFELQNTRLLCHPEQGFAVATWLKATLSPNIKKFPNWEFFVYTSVYF